MQFSDLTLNQTLEGELSTMGHIQLDPNGHMTGKLVCGQLTSKGNFDGNATVYGQITLCITSITTGKLIARSLCIERGACYRGRVNICLKPRKPDAFVQRLATRTTIARPRRRTTIGHTA
jgi:cytoskeletal protein CcmA (bactofilin family)